jgi:hypothetical protein
VVVGEIVREIVGEVAGEAGVGSSARPSVREVLGIW